MFKQFLKALKILEEGDRVGFYLICFFLITSVFLEFLSFTLIVPIISIIFETQSETKNIIPILNLNFLSKDYLNEILLGFLLIIILKLIILYIFEKKLNTSLYKIQIGLNKNIYTNLLSQSWDQITKKSVSEISRIASGSDVMTYVTQGIYNYMIVIKNISIMLALGIFLIKLNHEATIIILLAFLIFTIIFTKFHSKNAINASIKVKNLREIKLKNNYETIQGLREIKLFGFAKKIIDYYSKNEEKIAVIQVKRRLVDILPKIFLELTFIFTLLAFIFVFQNKGILINFIPTISIFVLVFARMVPLITTINTLIQRIKFSNFGINETINLIQQSKNFKNEKNIDENLSESKNIIKINDNSTLKITNLSFGYGENQVFDNINLNFETNKIISVTGKNGSGKSTFLDLLSTLIKPNSGEIKLDEQNLYDLRSSWRNEVGYLAQNFFIFDDTLLKNIVFYNSENLNNELLMRALEISGLNEVVNKLPNGLETNLGSMVKFLSGGQKQKIAIARVIYRDPKIYIFDEPTSSLDTESEKIFIDTLKNLKSKNKFIFVITHSKNLISNCDDVYLIDNKKIIKSK